MQVLKMYYLIIIKLLNLFIFENINFCKILQFFFSKINSPNKLYFNSSQPVFYFKKKLAKALAGPPKFLKPGLSQILF